MTSRISFSKIAKEDLRRRIWMLALSCLGSFLAMPITFLLANRNYANRMNRLAADVDPVLRIESYYTEFFTSYGILMSGIVLGAGAVIVAVWGFRYLYSRKMVDLYHSIPVKRDRLFLVTYVNGLLIWLLPMLVSVAATLLIMLANMIAFGTAAAFGTVVVTALRMTLVCILCFLMFYHFCLVCVMLCGNAFNALFTTAILGVSAVALYGIYFTLSEAFYDTFVTPVITWDQIYWLSPLASPIALMVDFCNTGAGALFWGAAGSIFEHGYVLRIGSLLVMLFNFWMARRLYLKRPSELAEHGVDHKHAQSIVRICGGILAALFGAMIFLWIVDEDALHWQIFGVFLCGILAFGITDIILHMNFRSFFAHKKQMTITTVAACLVLVVFHFDLTGFDTRLPAKSSIKEAAIALNQYDDGSYIFRFKEDGTASIDYDAMAAYNNLDLLYPLLEHVAWQDTVDSPWVTSITVDLDTTFGPFQRRYSIREQDVELVRAIVESDEYRIAHFPASSGLLPLTDRLSVNSRLGYSEYSTEDATQIQAIMDAYTEDFLANYTLEKINTGMRVGNIDMTYQYRNKASESFRGYGLGLPVYSHFTRTIAAIKEYYPELCLEKEDMTIQSFNIPVDSQIGTLYDLRGLDIPEELLEDPNTTGYYDPYVMESTSSTTTLPQLSWGPIAEVIGEYSVTAAEDIEALMPYLYPGNLHYSPFDAFNHYEYVGSARLSDGSTVSCYADVKNLPLEAPASLVDYLQENMDKIE